VEQYSALPLAGGLLDQPAGMLKKIRIVMNVFHSVKLYEQQGRKAGEMVKWKQEHEDAWNIISEINELRERYG